MHKYAYFQQNTYYSIFTLEGNPAKVTLQIVPTTLGPINEYELVRMI